MTGISIALFTLDRWLFHPHGDRPQGVRALFANPFLKVAAILLLALIVFGGGTAATNGNIAWLVVATVGTTVVGADFVLLVTAIIRGNRTFIQEFFQTERARFDMSVRIARHH